MTKTTENKKVYMEFMRILAAFFVIYNHVNIPFYYYTEISNSWYGSIALFFVSKVAVPVFLMISGALLLNKVDTRQKYIKRILRIVFLWFICSIIYYVVFVKRQEWSFYHFLKCLLNSVTNAYWYLFLYIGILLILPFLQKLVVVLSKKEIELFLFISLVIGGVLPMLPLFIGLEIKNEFLEVIFSPYIGLLFAGYYIEKYYIITKKKALFSGVIFIVLIAFQVWKTGDYFKLDSLNYLLLDNRIFITITFSAICFYIMIKYIFTHIKIPRIVCKIIIYIGSLTFGIYLLSDLIINLMHPIYWEYFLNIDPFFGLIGLAGVVFIVCSIFVTILKIIPILKKII